jgi:hypothetical protein
VRRACVTETIGTTEFCGPNFGPKHWLLVKEGIHIILDRILLKDNSHLTSKCPLYGRLSRVEKRAAVVRYATALVLKLPLHRNVLVDTISMCVYEACEQEALLEAPNSEPRRAKPRVPFMQKGRCRVCLCLCRVSVCLCVCVYLYVSVCACMRACVCLCCLCCLCVVSCRVLSCPVVSCRVLSCPVLSCRRRRRRA